MSDTKISSDYFKKIVSNRDNWDFEQDIEFNKIILKNLLYQRAKKLHGNDVYKKNIDARVDEVIKFYNKYILYNLFDTKRN